MNMVIYYGETFLAQVSGKSDQGPPVADFFLIFLVFTPTHVGEAFTGNNNWK